jgi:hypothetical protein
VLAGAWRQFDRGGTQLGELAVHRLAREHWEHLFVPRHLTQFAPKSLANALERVNLRVESVSFVLLEYDPHSWLLSTLNRFGFPQNLLLRWLAGGWRRGQAAGNYPTLLTPTGLLMVLTIAVLFIPSLLLSALSWPFAAGSIMEVRAVRVGSAVRDRPAVD